MFTPPNLFAGVPLAAPVHVKSGMEVTAHTLWPTNIYSLKFDEALTIKAARLAAKLLPREIEYPQQRPWASSDLLHLEPDWQPVRMAIESALAEVGAQMGLAQPLKLSGMWVNVQDGHHDHQPHTHANSYLSGCFYLQCNDTSQQLQFWDPRPQANSWRVPQTDDQDTGAAAWQPWPGLCLIFPSWLQHATVRSAQGTATGLRVSLAFNAVPQGAVNIHSARINIL